MAVTVTFYNLSKKYNSTVRPTGGTDIPCDFRSGASKQNCKLLIRSENAPSYNYMYIQIFERYYYITDCEFDAEKNFWLITGECDVLATFRTQILASTQTVLRTSMTGAIDVTLADSLALARAESRKVTQAFGSDLLPSFTTNAAEMAVICNVAGSGFVCMTLNSYNILLNKLFVNQSPSEDFAKWLMNPASHFMGQMGFPIRINDMVPGQSPFHPVVAWWQITDVNAYRPVPSLTYSTYVTVPLHPDSDGTSQHYLNNPPYTYHSLYVGGFGQIPLDTNKITSGGELKIDLTIDLYSGGAWIKVTDFTTGLVCGFSSAQMGFDVAMASRNPVNVVTTTASVLMGGAVGGVAGAIGGGLHALSQLEGAGGAITSGSTGGIGGWIDFANSRLDTVQKRVKEAGINEVGRPSYHTGSLSTFEGHYVECATGTVFCAGDFNEKLKIKDLLKGGVYIE